MSIFFRFLARTFDGSPPATRRRGAYSETLAGGQPGPARAAPPATFEEATRGSGSCGGCGSGGRPQRAAPVKQHVTRHNNSSSTWGGPKVTKAERMREVRVMHSARKRSCIVLCIVRVNRRRGQWQGDQRARGETNNNKKTKKPQNGRGQGGEALGTGRLAKCSAQCVHGQRGQEKDGGGDRAPGGRTQSSRAQR